MKIPALITALLFAAAGAKGGVGEAKVFPASGLADISIGTVAGPAVITAGGKSEVSVVVTGEEPGTCVITLKTEGKKFIARAEGAPKAGAEKRGFWRRLFGGYDEFDSRYQTCRAGFTITAPATLKLSAESVSGELKISGFSAAVEAETTSGRIAAENLGAGLSARSVSGPVSVSEVAGAVDAGTTSGAMMISGLKGGLKAGSVSGDISVSSVAGAAAAETTSGDVKLSGIGGAIAVGTVSGDVSGVSCAKSLEVNTTSGKVVFGGLGGPAKVSGGSGDVELSWAKAPASGEARVETVSGAVRLFFPAGASVGTSLSSTSGKKVSEFSGGAFRVEAETVSGDISVLKGK